MAERRGLAAGLAIVVAALIALFVAPSGYFAAATFVATGCMIVAAFWGGAFRNPGRPKPGPIVAGLVSALLLYGVFYGGAWAVSEFHPFGITSASESSIYSLISSPSNPLYLQLGVLFFDSAGYETYFRGVLQKRLQPRMGVAAAPAVALFDALLHTATLNPLWVGATFVTDLLWGLTYYYGRGIQSSFTSHLVWDVAIFIVRPIR